MKATAAAFRLGARVRVVVLLRNTGGGVAVSKNKLWRRRLRSMQHSDLAPGLVRLSTIRFRNRRERPITGSGRIPSQKITKIRRTGTDSDHRLNEDEADLQTAAVLTADLT